MDLAAIAQSPTATSCRSAESTRGVESITSTKRSSRTRFPNDWRSLRLSPDTWSVVVGAAAALARLDQAGRQVPNPELFRRPTLRREAQSTSALEGTHAAFTDLLEADLDEGRTTRSAEVREVLNYVQAAEHAFQWIEERPLTIGVLGELQRILVRHTPGDLSDAGGIRDRHVVVGAQRHPITESRYVPPPPGVGLRASVDAWLHWLNAPSDIPAVVRAALAHYPFESLHPFSDDNGRLGRLIVVLQLMRYEVLHYSLLIVSPWFEARRRGSRCAAARQPNGRIRPVGPILSRTLFEHRPTKRSHVSRRSSTTRRERRTLIRDRRVRGVRAQNHGGHRRPANYRRALDINALRRFLSGSE